MNFLEVANNLMFDNCINVGTILKPHGTKGQFTANINVFLDDLKEESIFVEIDNYLVPFFIDCSKCKTEISPAILKFQNIDTVEKISEFKARRLFLPKILLENIEESLTNWETFVVGYLVIEKKIGKIGEIIEFADDKKNPLFVVEYLQSDVLIPLNAITIIDVDHENKTLILEIPENIINLEEE